MRLSIILVICFIAVTVSARGVRTRRGFFEDLKNKTKNAFEEFKHLFESHNKNKSEEVKVIPIEETADRSKRYVNPLELINNLDNPVKFTQTFVELLAQQARLGKRSVNPLDLLNSLNDPNKFALNVFSLVKDMVNQQTGGNPLQLIADLQNPQKAFKSILKIVSDMAQERPKRNIASDMQEQAQKLYDNIKAALEKIFKKPVPEVVA